MMNKFIINKTAYIKQPTIEQAPQSTNLNAVIGLLLLAFIGGWIMTDFWGSVGITSLLAFGAAINDYVKN